MCVILYTKINGKQILAKNRDRTHNPEIKIFHEIRNGVEIAYISDTKTGWVEGMSENNCGIVNSTLNIKDSKIVVQRSNFLRAKTHAIYKALYQKNIKKFFDELIKNENFEGNTLLVYENRPYHIEDSLSKEYTIDEVKKTSVYTNHGVNMQNTGFIKGAKGLSSFIRRRIVEKELEKELENLEGKCETQNHIYDKISHVLNKDYKNIDPRFHPYRDKSTTLKRVNNIDKNKKIVSTTGQLILNITDKELVYFSDENNSSKCVKYINKLPASYIPKIRVIVKYTKKNTQTRKIFPKKYLNDILYRFNSNKTRKHHYTEQKEK